MANVRYIQGLKATYLGLSEHLSNALYFCTDTKELFKGDDLYSDGVRLVANHEALPEYAVAADGILYVCEDNSTGFVLNSTRDGWIQVIHGVDNETIEVTGGLMAVKAVPAAKVTGLSDQLQSVVSEAIANGEFGVASSDAAGMVKPDSEQFTVAEDGSLTLTAVEISTVTGLEERLSNIEAAAVGGVHYKGAVETYEELPEGAAQGDLYEVKSDNSEWCYNGEAWFEYGKTTDLSPVATATLNAEQLAVNDGVLNIIGVSSDLVTYNGNTLTDVLDGVAQGLVWEEMSAE